MKKFWVIDSAHILQQVRAIYQLQPQAINIFIVKNMVFFTILRPLTVIDTFQIRVGMSCILWFLWHLVDRFCFALYIVLDTFCFMFSAERNIPVDIKRWRRRMQKKREGFTSEGFACWKANQYITCI